MENKTVAVIGCGGLGGYAVEYLVRLGVGRIIAVDGDVFSESNLNRQLLCTRDNIGESKAQQAKLRAEAVDPKVETIAVCEYLTAENAENILSGCDLVIDALDNIPSREILLNACEKLGLTLVHGAVGNNCFQLAVIKPGMKLPDCTTKEFHAEEIKAYVPAMCAAMQISEAEKLLLGRESTLCGKLLCVDLNYNEAVMLELRQER